MRTRWGVILGVLMALGSVLPSHGEVAFETLTEGQTIADFRTEVMYLDPTGKAMGARFRHNPSGFVLDLLRIQSVPQAFVWVNSPPPSNQGEPHTCEHLLLGKGTKGRYVASLEDMSLGSSSAFTMQLQTCYHYHTAAGTDVFFDLLEAKMDAMLQPTYSEEEIRREVCNMGYRINPEDSSLELEEKGTVYNEMVSSFERPWYHLGRALDLMLYGENHPLSNSSGGMPEHIRTMTPQDLISFHAENYRLGNMGMIVSLPDEVGIEQCLTKTSEIFARVQPDAELGSDPTSLQARLPDPKPAPAGQTRVTYFPHRNENEPGLLVYAWPAQLVLPNEEVFLLELLLDNLASGETSDLYRQFIDSKTRDMDLGATSVFTWLSSDKGRAIYVGFSNVRPDALDKESIDLVRDKITARLKEIASWQPGSQELADFNQRVENRILENKRGLRKFLNSPPGFGFRGSGAQWMEHMFHLQNAAGFRKSLSLDPEFEFAEDLLAGSENFWAEYIAKWKLDTSVPYTAAALPNPTMLAKEQDALAERITAFVTDYKDQSGAQSEQQAIAKYREDYDAKTAEIDAVAATIPMPGFVESPPLTLDDQLDYKVETIGSDATVVSSTFENISSGTFGLAFDLRATDPALLDYLPALPTLLTDVGVVVDGEPMAYDAMKEALRREILYLNAYFSVDQRTERTELVVKASGSTAAESKRASEWMKRVLFSADWRPENLSRIRDAVDQALSSRRNTMRYREEAWVQDPARAYVLQHNPLFLTADCFLTQVHALQRLRWFLKEEPTGDNLAAWEDFMDEVAGLTDNAGRDDVTRVLAGLLEGKDDTEAGRDTELAQAYDALPDDVSSLATDALRDLQATLAGLPPETLASDWLYLCSQIRNDLKRHPEGALTDLRALRDQLLRQDNVRSFIIANSTLEKQLQADIQDLVARLGATPSAKHAHRSDPLVLGRLASRRNGAPTPRFVGLLNENTRSGVFINTAPCASYVDHDRETLMNFLAARLYGGGGAHSMFMKTWSAGLAYSNGLRSNESSGRVIYYAERCPDLAQTMQFVVNELKNAPYDTMLADYAVAQAFAGYRSARRYEDRGEAMAANLADGLSPEVVAGFRKGILALRDHENLYDELHNRMPTVYGEVLPGYGPTAAESPGASYFVIGPESQFKSLEDYLKAVEDPDAEVVRLYPRDFWLVAEPN